MLAEHYYWLAIGWMWLLGGAVLWVFIDELVHDQVKAPRTIVLCVLWPLSLPSLLAFYAAFVQPQQKK